jgi:hypothetical protein
VSDNTVLRKISMHTREELAVGWKKGILRNFVILLVTNVDREINKGG